jgi:hypothetical protein
MQMDGLWACVIPLIGGGPAWSSENHVPVIAELLSKQLFLGEEQTD